MLRIDALRAIYPELSRCVVVTNMGAAPAELFSLGHQPGFFYLWHSMGLASSVGLGIALSRPEQQVVVIDGDGSLLMNLGSLTTLARYRPANLVHIVFDNEVLLSVGRSFTTATATGTNLAAVAAAAGVPRTATCRTEEELRRAFTEALAAHELSTLVAKVEPVGPAGYFIDLHYIESRFQFQRHLRSLSSGKEGGQD
ncbi:MAG TPA: thiamine pyrophosphate-dependent enzyme [Thermoanaerobaculia bacterium]|jgi:sulfopyruvate decarboxylase subunit beta|nr:thiamine pyrophosphate-dependent enzyme [Thermoanaerobaculia bacterium]